MREFGDTDAAHPAMRRFVRRFAVLALLAGSAALLAACASPQPKVASKKRSKEYFSESAYGVKASPRVSNLRTRLPRGGGRDQLGKPYKIKGKWYYPKEEPNYRKAGSASWYGDAFHGRLTANGEIYDMTHLTAAHPTMPLPSYARVTNSKNGSSVIVRVNDRGPYAHGRIIDLSRRAAEMLDYTQQGVAKVEVEYLGRAPLHGRDDEFLMASYRPGGRRPDPSDGLPSGVMIAMNGPTPTTSVGSTAAFAGQVRATVPFQAAPMSNDNLVLPDLGPIVPERPGIGLANRIGSGSAMSAMAYADDRVRRAAQVIEAFADAGSTNGKVIEALNRRYAAASEVSSEYIAAGTYSDRMSAEVMARALGGVGRVLVETDYRGDGFVVRIFPDGSLPVDEMLRTAWAAGAADAMTVRD